MILVQADQAQHSEQGAAGRPVMVVRSIALLKRVLFGTSLSDRTRTGKVSIAPKMNKGLSIHR